jgi:neutral ceramidase
MKALQFIIILTFTATFNYGQGIIKGNAGSVVITPPLEMDYTLGGYGARMSKPAEGIHDDIKAKVLVLDNGVKNFAIITMDILGFPPNVRPMIVKKLDDERWKEDNILLLPSHSHTSLEMFAINDKNIFGMPAIGIYQPELLEFVINNIAQLIQKTDQNLNEIKVGTGQMVLENLNRNRRGDASVDRELTVTRIDGIDDQPIAILVNWTAHPTIMSDEDMWVSSGWPGYLQRELESWIGKDITAMYYNGAEGDQSVIAGEGGSHYEKAENYGRSIAKHALSVYQGIDTKKNVKFDFTGRTATLPVPQPHPSFMQTGGEEYQLDEEKIQGLLNQIFPATTYLSSVRLGDLMIIGAPGELIASIGMDIKAEMKHKNITYPVIGGLANEWISYILTENEYHEGGYETSVSFYGKDLGKIIHKEMLETAKKLID